jgi:hypothetical protein
MIKLDLTPAAGAATPLPQGEGIYRGILPFSLWEKGSGDEVKRKQP